ncbi:MAG TPA: methylated-DNA--[protein]-cysteine S-methyltransferase [Solirubrobacterales bacterium]|nr:methylated-DNA--[protein]-cysteine S-methyltransferase [Solirubrobacterales bacterium]
MRTAAWTTCESPIGELTLVAGPRGVTAIHFAGHAPRLAAEQQQPLEDAAGQLASYFAGERQSFQLELDPHGTPLQLAVWRQLWEIPYGETTTYGEIAAAIDPSLYGAGVEEYERPRVVGTAIGSNPLPVVVPCHRVIGADGSLTGYFGGLERKRILLDLESGSEAGWTPPSKRAGGQTTLL